MVLMVARCLQEVLSSLLGDCSGVGSFNAEGVHADDAVFIFALDISFFLVSGLLRKLVEVIVGVKVAAPFLRHEEPRVPLLLLSH